MGCIQSSVDPNTIKLKECNDLRYKKRQAELDAEILYASNRIPRPVASPFPFIPYAFVFM